MALYSPRRWAHGLKLGCMLYDKSRAFVQLVKCDDFYAVNGLPEALKCLKFVPSSFYFFQATDYNNSLRFNCEDVLPLQLVPILVRS